MNSSPSTSSRLLRRLSVCAASIAAALVASTSQAAEPKLELKDNDVWVMAGDSITAQRQHTNYIEAFFRTRHPGLHLHFRNSGIGGNTTGSVLARFDYDVAAWKPTIVSIELGMNDVNGSQENYIKGMKALIEKIRAIPAQPVLISSSPVNDASLLNDWRSTRCEKIHPFTEALQKLAAEENIVFVDQYHPLINLWGKNRRDGTELAIKNGTWPPKPAPATPVPVATPAVTTAPTATAATPAPAKATPPPAPPVGPSLINLQGDPVHPGPIGQYTMAATILKGLKVDGAMSSATIKPDGQIVEAKRCKITDVVSKDGKLSFTRLDEVSPWPIFAPAKPAFELLPEGLLLSQYLLKVPGLADGDYQVTINGKPAAKVSAKVLAAGWNITSAFDSSVLADRANQINNLIAKLQLQLNNDWRNASKAKDAEKLAAAQKAIEEHEAEIQKAIQPVAFKFEISK